MALMYPVGQLQSAGFRGGSAAEGCEVGQLVQVPSGRAVPKPRFWSRMKAPLQLLALVNFKDCRMAGLDGQEPPQQRQRSYRRLWIYCTIIGSVLYKRYQVRVTQI